jgi:hypothetical protein
MTAGIGAANVLATPPDVAAGPSAKDVDLAASITIPIIDIDTPGPVSIIRQVFLTLGAEPNTIFASTSSKAGTIYDLPGLYTNFQQTGGRDIFATRVPGQSIGTGYASNFADVNSWSLLDLVESASNQSRSSAVNLTGFTGGAQGIGAGLDGVLSNSSSHRELSVLGSGITSDVTSTFAGGGGELSVMPFDGFKAVGGGNLINVNQADTSLRLGSLEVGGGGAGALGGGAGVCLGSAKGTGGCTGEQTAFASLQVPIQVGFGTGGSNTNVFSVDIPTNLAVAVGGGQFSAQGDIGGTVKVGSVTLGRVIPINIQFPGGSSMLSSTNARQQQSVRNSFFAAPRTLGSDSGSASTGRHAARDFVNSAISEVKTSVDKALNKKPRHAKPDTTTATDTDD